jgi:hypothetical protein
VTLAALIVVVWLGAVLLALGLCMSAAAGDRALA